MGKTSICIAGWKAAGYAAAFLAARDVAEAKTRDALEITHDILFADYASDDMIQDVIAGSRCVTIWGPFKRRLSVAEAREVLVSREKAARAKFDTPHGLRHEECERSFAYCKSRRWHEDFPHWHEGAAARLAKASGISLQVVIDLGSDEWHVVDWCVKQGAEPKPPIHPADRWAIHVE